MPTRDFNAASAAVLRTASKKDTTAFELGLLFVAEVQQHEQYRGFYWLMLQQTGRRTHDVGCTCIAEMLNGLPKDDLLLGLNIRVGSFFERYGHRGVKIRPGER